MSASANRTDLLLSSLLGLRKAGPRAAESTWRAERVEKAELEELLAACGLHTRGNGREAARILNIDEKTLRAYRDVRRQDSFAPPEVRDTLTEYASWLRLNSRFSRAG